MQAVRIKHIRNLSSVALTLHHGVRAMRKQGNADPAMRRQRYSFERGMVKTSQKSKVECQNLVQRVQPYHKVI
jgi:hypothetical protein